MATATGTHKVGGGVDGVMTSMTTGSFSAIGGDGFFDCFIPIGVVSHERSVGSFHFSKRLVELCVQPTRWSVEAMKDFVVVARGEL